MTDRRTGTPRTSVPLVERFRQYPVVYGILTLTVLSYAGQILGEFLLGYDAVAVYGAKSNTDILNGQLWRLITPVLVHGSGYHLLVNMYSLYAIGPGVEKFFGHTRTLAVYALSGISGSLLSLAFSDGRSVGASGAIFGFLGALGGFLFIHRDAFGRFGQSQLRQIISVALINLAIGFMPGIDNWGHLGGLIGGIVLSFFLGPRYSPVRLAHDRVHFVDIRPFKRIWPRSILALGVLLLGTALTLLGISS